MKSSVVLVLTASALFAQSFEVVSVRRSAPETGDGARSAGAIPRQQEPGRIRYPAVTLQSVIALAYGVPYDLVQGPQWLAEERYDIAATLPSGTSEDQVPAMLRHLLAERFGMIAHEETKPRAGFALTVGKGRPILTKATEKSQRGFVTTVDSITFNKVTLFSFAKGLAVFIGRPVTDETGIQGEYDITVRATMEELRSGAVSGAIQELGLKLAPRTAPAKFVIVNKATRVPTDN